MEVFNKIYSQVSSSVSSTVSQLSGVLPGNPVTREFEASAHIASAGPGLLWKVYKGYKRSTKQPASIFVLEKRQLEKWSKTDRDIILETVRRGIAQLTKIRHPQVLTVQHPLEESRESLAFATEPVFASVANVLGKTTNMPQPANMSDYKFYDIEIKYGLRQIGEGLAFLHNDVKLLHKNIAPESIVINAQGVWKIFGFEFSVRNVNPANLPSLYPCEGYIPSLPEVCQSNLEYLAPECVLSQTNTHHSDMFSLGMLAYILNAPGNHPFCPVKDLAQFKVRIEQLKSLGNTKLQCIPEALRHYVKLLLSVNADSRPDAHQFVKIPYFDDVGVRTLNYLDSLLQWDNVQKSQFYKGLPEALPKLPQRVKIQRVLVALSRDLAQPTMIPFILPSIFDIAEKCTTEEFCEHVLPHLKPVMRLQEPVQILLIMLQKMEILLKLTPAHDVQQHVLPMLYRGLDSDSPQIHELCLAVLPTFANLLDHANVKNSLLPRIKRLCLSTSSLSVRVNCLLCVGRLLEHLDKWLVLDEVLPFLPQIPSREPAVLMGILGIYKLAMNHKKLGISKEIIATRILPFLMPLCIENGLTLTQFNALVALVKQMFALVETEHRTKLEQLNSVRDEQKMLTSAMPTVVDKRESLPLDQAFTGLGLDTFVKQKTVPPPLPSIQPLEPVKPANQSQAASAKDLIGSSLNDWSNQNASWNVGTVTTNQNPVWANQNLPGNGWTNQNAAATNLIKHNAATANWTNQTVAATNWTNQNAAAPNLTIQNTAATNWSNQNAGATNWITNQNTAATNWTNQNATATGWTNQNANRSSNGNWSALDNLLPMTTPNKTPMAQKQPLMPITGNTTQNNNNDALSKDDIMDLLG